jgi:hypothetical protein
MLLHSACFNDDRESNESEEPLWSPRPGEVQEDLFDEAAHNRYVTLRLAPPCIL